MPGFDDFILRILSSEGGYVNNPADPGGETKFGISKRAYPKLQIFKLSWSDAVEIYRRDYWNRISGDLLPPAVAFQVLDVSINSGVDVAIRWLQRSVSVPVDGVIGPITLAAVRATPPVFVVLALNAERLRFYAKLPAFKTFGVGWTRRVADNLESALKDLT